MTPDDIFAKVTAGELSGEELTNAVSGLEVDQQAELRKKFADETAKTMTEMSGIRKEKQRVEDLLRQRQEELDKDGNPPPSPSPAPAPAANDDFAVRFREEQKQKAVNKFTADYNLNDDEKSKILETFEKMDSGKMDAENIYDDLVGVYAFVNKDRLVEADKERKAREAAAAAEVAQAAGGAQGAPNDGNQPPKYSEEVMKLAQAAGISPEAAKKDLEMGAKRVYG